MGMFHEIMIALGDVDSSGVDCISFWLKNKKCLWQNLNQAHFSLIVNASVEWIGWQVFSNSGM